MNFMLQIPSLQYIAQVKISTCLWTQRDVFSQFVQPAGGLRHLPGYVASQELTTRKAILEKVESKISTLSLPEPYKKRLLNFVLPIKHEIIEWCRYYNREAHNCKVSDILLLKPQLCWNMHGTVDHRKSAELMVKDERVDVETRYEIACINGLEKAARELIDLIPQKRKWGYIHNVRSMKREDHYLLINYFTCILSDRMEQLIRQLRPLFWPGESINQYFFRVMLRSGNRMTCEYFFEKLNWGEKKRVLERYRKGVFRSIVGPTCGHMYYLSLMNDEQQKHVFRECTYNLLRGLLRWPLQSFFVEAAECGWCYLDKDACGKVLTDIAKKIYLGFRDCDYSRLFWEFWPLIPAEYKRDYLYDNDYLISLINTRKETFIQLILMEGSLEQMTELFINEYRIRRVLMEESVISETALIECKEAAALISSNEPEDEEKRLRSENLNLFVAHVMQSRN